MAPANLSWISGLRARFPELAVRENVMMRDYTTFRIGGPADAMAAPGNAEALASLYAWARAEGVPALILGGGSNILVSDGGIRGLVIQTAAMSGVEADAPNASVTAWCGARIAKV
ncbi:MAG: FAD-binding protein, partial [Oscillospiraceae bacterium]|nr:FAD-binding protein [Oscillospiraceae bacterium]